MKIVFSLLTVLISASAIYSATFTNEFGNNSSILPTLPATETTVEGYPTDLRITRQGVIFNFVNLGTAGSSATYYTSALSPYQNPTSATPFKIEWKYSTTKVAVTVIDNQPDSDIATMRAFNCNNQQIGTASVTIPGNGTTTVFRQLSVAARGICSIELIGGSVDAPHSVYYDNLVITTDNNPNGFSNYFYSDYTVFRPVSGTWFIDPNNELFYSTFAVRFGAANDKPVPADYSGDNAPDYGVYRSGVWYIGVSCNGSGNGIAYFPSICSNRGAAFGLPDDVPMPADFDGDGKADVAVWRPSNGIWYILNSANNQVSGIQFGQAGDIPITGFFDGDDRADTVVFRPSNGYWYILGTQSGFRAVQFGQNGDKPVSADYDGDAINDIAVFRNGVWYILQSLNNSVRGASFGSATDIPIPGNYKESLDPYEGRPDGKANIAVFRPSNGTWYIKTDDGFYARQWGQQGDVPISLVNN